MKKQPWLLFVLATALLTACSEDVKTPADIYKGQSAETIFKDGDASLAKGSYTDAVSRFEGLDALYPFSPYEEQAQLNIIYAYYKTGDYAMSAAAADRYIHLYPRGAHVDYAYYMKGIANTTVNRGLGSNLVQLDISSRDLGSAKEAFNDFGELVRRFPNSPYAAAARSRMVYLRNMLAQSEVNIAQFYYDRRAYVAAANRANAVVQDYQQAPAVIQALALMVKSYRQLDLNEPANKALQVLAYNYPDSKEYKELVGKQKT
ncbi:MAG: outer membrane protein assembly factor BamD [Gammaproteobacteria bacterium]|nr:outer membrane protein assembly factor BamD [Gammaproteobacteria bacterium]